MTPSTTEASVSALRPMRVNGRPRPRLTERGNLVPLSRRWIRSARPVCAVMPALIACAAGSLRARRAGTSAASITRTGMPSAAVRFTHGAKLSSSTPKPSTASCTTGLAKRLPASVPSAQPANAGIDTITRYTAMTWFGV